MLVPGVPYNVRIAALNGAGQGEFSVSIHFTRELGMKLYGGDVHIMS